MFDLEGQISRWRQQFGGTVSIGAANLAELETHLRDTFAEYEGKGLTGEESFWLATRRIGAPREVAAEFARENPALLWRGRVRWMLVGYLGLSLLLSATGTLARLSAAAGMAGGLTARDSAIVYGVVEVALLLAMVWGLVRLARNGIPARLAGGSRWFPGGVRSIGIWVGALLSISLVAVPLAGTAVQIAMARLMGAAELGAYFYSASLVQFVLAVLIPLTFLWLIVWSRRLDRQEIAN